LKATINRLYKTHFSTTPHVSKRSFAFATQSSS